VQCRIDSAVRAGKLDSRVAELCGSGSIVCAVLTTASHASSGPISNARRPRLPGSPPVCCTFFRFHDLDRMSVKHPLESARHSPDCIRAIFAGCSPSVSRQLYDFCRDERSVNRIGWAAAGLDRGCGGRFKRMFKTCGRDRGSGRRCSIRGGDPGRRGRRALEIGRRSVRRGS